MTSHVTDDGVRLHVEITGPDEAPTVVLVHGLAGSVALGWRATGVLDRLDLPGDHFTAVAAPAFTDAIVELALVDLNGDGIPRVGTGDGTTATSKG